MGSTLSGLAGYMLGLGHTCNERCEHLKGGDSSRLCYTPPCFSYPSENQDGLIGQITNIVFERGVGLDELIGSNLSISQIEGRCLTSTSSSAERALQRSASVTPPPLVIIKNGTGLSRQLRPERFSKGVKADFGSSPERPVRRLITRLA